MYKNKKDGEYAVVVSLPFVDCSKLKVQVARETNALKITGDTTPLAQKDFELVEEESHLFASNVDLEIPLPSDIESSGVIATAIPLGGIRVRVKYRAQDFTPVSFQHYSGNLTLDSILSSPSEPSP